MPGLTKEEIQSYYDERNLHAKNPVRIETVGEMSARLYLTAEQRHLRSGDTISGPTLMWLADAAMYTAILGTLGPVYQALTTNLNINFLRKPGAVDIIAECRLLKVGKQFVFGEVELFSVGMDKPVAHVTCTYSIPKK